MHLFRIRLADVYIEHRHIYFTEIFRHILNAVTVGKVKGQSYIRIVHGFYQTVDIGCGIDELLRPSLHIFNPDFDARFFGISCYLPECPDLHRPYIFRDVFRRGHPPGMEGERSAPIFLQNSMVSLVWRMDSARMPGLMDVRLTSLTSAWT